MKQAITREGKLKPHVVRQVFELKPYFLRLTEQ